MESHQESRNSVIKNLHGYHLINLQKQPIPRIKDKKLRINEENRMITQTIKVSTKYITRSKKLKVDKPTKIIRESERTQGTGTPYSTKYVITEDRDEILETTEMFSMNLLQITFNEDIQPDHITNENRITA